MREFFLNPFVSAVSAIVLSAAVRALPEPGSAQAVGSAKSTVYGWFYRFANGVLANFDLTSRKVRPE